MSIFCDRGFLLVIIVLLLFVSMFIDIIIFIAYMFNHDGKAGGSIHSFACFISNGLNSINVFNLHSAWWNNYSDMIIQQACNSQQPLQKGGVWDTQNLN